MYANVPRKVNFTLQMAAVAETETRTMTHSRQEVFHLSIYHKLVVQSAE